MRFNFNPVKACQAAALLLARAGGRMNYMKLIKLMYIAEREALLTRAWPLTGDGLVSMKHGPILSCTLNLIKGTASDPYWARHIRRSGSTYDVRLCQDPRRDELSQIEVELLTSVYDRFGHMNQFALRDYCHKFPEWRDPGESSLPIDLDDIGTPADALRESLEVAGIHRIVGAVS
jgi:uncharacterized phage-associated protein